MSNLEQSRSRRDYIAGIPCDFISQEEYLRRIESVFSPPRMRGSERGFTVSKIEPSFTHIITLNAEMVVAAQNDGAFKKAIEHAELIIPDSAGVLWARDYTSSRHPRPVRGSMLAFAWIPAFAGMTTLFSLFKFLFSKKQPLTGIDSIFLICGELEKQQGVAYLIGGEESDRNTTAKILQQKYPSLKVTPLDDSFLEATSYKLQAKPSVIFVALGAPKQTFWIEEHRAVLEQAGIRIAIGIGGAFAMISGRLPRAPKWMRTAHLEWLWRFILESNRWKRICNAIIVFPRIVSGYPHSIT